MSQTGDDLRKRVKQFALRVVRLYTCLPRRPEAEVIGKQVLRSANLAGAHHHEGHRARSTAEFVSKFEVAIQELDETTFWLDVLIEGEIVPAHLLADLQRENQELIAIFVASVKTAKSHSLAVKG
jgi:four helix bundle protein